jgi:hypothetical protein
MLNQLSRFFLRSAGSGPDSARSRDTANVEIVLPWLLAREGEETQFPVAYLEFLRTCLERKRFPIIPVKKYRGGHDQDSARRFASLLGALSNLPAIEIAVAIRLARVSDSLHSNAASFQNSSWSGDIRAHFEMSSSFGHKGRVLTTIVRFMRCSRCLELGTAYGMSGLFILEALSARGAETQLITVEGSERLHRMASALLESCFPGRVSCEYGWTSHVLPQLIADLRRLNSFIGPVRRHVDEGRLVEQGGVHHAVLGQMVDDQVHELDLVGGSDLPARKPASTSFAASRSRPTSERTKSPSPCDSLVGALRCPPPPHTALGKHAFQLGEIGGVSGLVHPQLVDRNMVLMRAQERLRLGAELGVVRARGQSPAARPRLVRPSRPRSRCRWACASACR